MNNRHKISNSGFYPHTKGIPLGGITRNSIESNTIEWLRFVMAALIVFMHSAIPFDDYLSNSANQVSFFSWVLIVRIISQLAVPMFFFVSGYFFFSSIKYDIKFYSNKLISRAKSLLVPYLTWNILYYFYEWGLSSVFHQPFNKSFLSAFYIFFDITYVTNILGVDMPRNTVPADGPLWFVRDLIILAIISPLLFRLAKGKLSGIIALSVLAICLIFDIWIPVTVVSICGVFFFTLGAYCRIHNVNIFRIMPPPISITVSIFAQIVIFCEFYFELSGYEYVMRTFQIFGILATLTIAYKLYRSAKMEAHTLLSESSFFIYASHIAIYPIVAKIINVTFRYNDTSYLVGWMATSIVTFVICLVMYNLLKRYSNKMCFVLTGGR